MKIALCISGQMRTYKECYASVKKHFVNDNIDIFVSTWDIIGQTEKKKRIINIHNLNFNKVKEKKNIITKEELNNLYKPKDIFIERFKNEYHDKINNIKIPTDFYKKYENIKNNLPMFYMMYRCNEMKTNYENINNFSYDIVIRFRPDMNGFNINFDRFKERCKNTLFLFPSCGHKNKSDRFGMGCSKTMNTYMNVYNKLKYYWNDDQNNIPEIYKLPITLKQRNDEHLMHHHLLKNNIKTKQMSSVGQFR